MEPGVARVAVAVNMYQTAAWRNPKTLVNENSYKTTQPKEQPARRDPNLNSKLNAKENW
jgi:hypothetical protein